MRRCGFARALEVALPNEEQAQGGTDEADRGRDPEDAVEPADESDAQRVASRPAPCRRGWPAGPGRGARAPAGRLRAGAVAARAERGEVFAQLLSEEGVAATLEDRAERGDP